jgi:hypothetical protein
MTALCFLVQKQEANQKFTPFDSAEDENMIGTARIGCISLTDLIVHRGYDVANVRRCLGR